MHTLMRKGIQLESADYYFLKPIDALDPDYDIAADYTPEDLEKFPDLMEDNALVVGTKYIMNEVAVYMEEDDVIATTGVADERCVIITSLSRKRCLEIIQLGRQAFDKKAREVLK